MIPNMPNTNTPDVLGALSGRPAAMMGGPMGMLANAPGNGPGGLPRGALTSPEGGGISPQMIQMMLMGMKAGGGLMAGKPVDQVLGGVAQDIVPMAQMAQMDRQQQGQQEMQPGQQTGQQPGMDPKQDEMMRVMEMLRARGMLGGSEGSAPGMPGQPPPGLPGTSTSPFINQGMMR